MTGPAGPTGGTGGDPSPVAVAGPDPAAHQPDADQPAHRDSTGTGTDAVPAGTPRRWDRVGEYGRAVILVLPAWVVGRVLVVGALVAAHLGVSTLRPHNPAAALRVHQGLLAWDGGWYDTIARHGYTAAGQQSLRFYPAFPLAGRYLGDLPGVGAGPALVAVSNLCALAAMAALVVLIRHDLGDAGLARRSAWLLGLAPPAYSLVLGYADATLLLCSVVTFLGARTGRWWWAAAAGLVGGLVRPVGVLLVVPVAVELWRQRRTASPGRRWVPRITALVAPVAGTAIFLGWVGAQFGDPWLPLRVQQQSGHRGGFTVPLSAMAHSLASVVHGHHLGSALHIPWALVCLALLVVVFRRLPLAYGAFSAAVLVVSLSSSNLDSFERYALGAFPLVVAASTFTSRRSVEGVVLVVAAIGMTAYALLAFVGVVVP